MGSRKRPYHFYEQNRFREFFVPTKYAWILCWIWWPFRVCKRNYLDSLAWFMTTKCPLNLILNISKQTSHEYPQSPLSHKMGCWSSFFTENMSVTYKIKLRLCIVYGPAPKTSLAKLDYIHTQRFRISLGEFRSSPVESFYGEAHEPPLFIIETHRKNVSAIYPQTERQSKKSGLSCCVISKTAESIPKKRNSY